MADADVEAEEAGGHTDKGAIGRGGIVDTDAAGLTRSEELLVVFTGNA